jgi:hypothetical protein
MRMFFTKSTSISKVDAPPSKISYCQSLPCDFGFVCRCIIEFSFSDRNLDTPLHVISRNCGHPSIILSLMQVPNLKAMARNNVQNTPLHLFCGNYSFPNADDILRMVSSPSLYLLAHSFVRLFVRSFIHSFVRLSF